MEETLYRACKDALYERSTLPLINAIEVLRKSYKDGEIETF